MAVARQSDDEASGDIEVCFPLVGPPPSACFGEGGDLYSSWEGLMEDKR